ncbi:MAG: DNA translocase FtsK 4TM domain-containing protein [Campylobacterota bacterium]|nr:DNA translocase FtsK 4TM domain-containing protein [Campylobacterota bacterium]
MGDSGLIGRFGELFAGFNKHMFGYLAYVYLIAALVPVFFIYRSPGFDMRRAELVIASILMLFSLAIFQAILVTDDMRGWLGGSFVDFLDPFIGLFGVWIFWAMATAVAVVIILEKGIDELLLELKHLMGGFSLPRFKNHDEEDEMEEYKAPSAVKSGKKAGRPAAKQKAAPILEDDINAYDRPAFERHAIQTTLNKQESEGDSSSDDESPFDLTQNDEPKTILSEAKKANEHKHAVIVEELEENKKLQDQIETGKAAKPKNFKLPSVDFLQKPPKSKNSVDEAELDDKIHDLIAKLSHFKIEGDVVRTYAGPVVSTFEFKPAANIKVSKILNLQDDLAMALRAETIRIQAPIPGKDVVGIEIPNKTVETIYLREILESKLFKEASSPLTIVLGKDIVGNPFITDLKKLPHLLIAGTTGSGKSVGINAMILSLLYKNSPDQLKLVMIDPKMLEFSIYNDIPHLLTPVITKAKQAIVALNNMVHEMERRYQLMSESRTKNIENYNEKILKSGGKPFPYIVVIIDELADLMMTSGKDVEHSIARLAQMARASGIHLVVATQRPSVDVVTGLIKANLPSRISYRVGQKVDSKIILDQQGAESLLGRGDMLFTPPGMTGLIRLHAPWSSEDEIDKIVEFIKSQREAEYDKSFLQEEGTSGGNSDGDIPENEIDPLYDEAKNIVLTDRKTSISYLQRRLQIGYNRSARIVEQLQMRGVLSEPNAKGNREIVGV